MTGQPEVSSLHEFCLELAQGAGALATQRRRHEFSVASKSSPTDLVTGVDREVEAWLVETITARRPSDAILGEEGGGRPGHSRVRWVLDPIDGTVNFLLGIPSWAVSVAAELDEQVVAGCVCNPTSGEVFHAWLGGGAYLGEQRLGGRRSVPLTRAVVGTGFGYAADRRGRQAAVVAQLLPLIADIRRLGSASLDLCALAAGRLDAYYEVGLNPWDWSAGLLVALESGCIGSGLRGRAAGAQMTAVAAPDLAPQFFDLLERLDADLV